MADIALVHLALDSSGVVAGEKQASRALQNVESSMQRAEKQSQRFGSALQGLGGPVGRVGGEISNLGGQLESLTGSFGLAGGAAVAAIAGVAALGSALVKLTLEGVAVSDSMLDVAESTGLSIDQVQRLSAAARLSGESADFAERSFRTFENVIQSAINDPASDAAKALNVLGINAVEAGQDTGDAFLKAISNLKEYRSTTEGAAASNEVFGKSVGQLVRSSENLTTVLQGSRKELEESGVIATERAIDAAGRLDAKINHLDNQWTVFKQNLAGTSAGDTVANTLDGISTSLGLTFAGLQKVDSLISKSTYLQLLLGLGKVAVNPVGLLAPLAGADEVAGPPNAGFVTGGRGGGGGGGARAGRAARAAELRLPLGRAFDPIALLRPALERLEREADDAADMARALAEVDAREIARNLTILGNQVANITEGVPLAVSGSPFQQARPGQIIPGLSASGLPPHPSTVRTEEQARLDEQFSAIFDDMLVSILTAQKTVGAAFAGLAIGVVDTFAIEFTKALRESFITPVVRGLTDMLQSALKDLFGGLSAGGLKGVFGGIAKGIGTIFGGFFASGGTLGPGKFGVAGERGPELIFSGNQPMHIAPVTAGSAGNVFNISVGVNAPSGTVDKRTQDQLAATVMAAVKRAQRNEGSR